MIRGRGERSSAPSKGVHRHARHVALRATLLALAVYLVACAVADIVVVGHLGDAVDARLSDRVAELVQSAAGRPATGKFGPLPAKAQTHGHDDLDDAPVFSWWVPAGSSAAVALSATAPVLPRPLFGVAGISGATIAGRPFRLTGAGVRGGRVVVATSVEQLSGFRSTLLVAEGSVLPFVLLTFFLVATVIGRRAAAPVERARQQQLDFTADASHELRTPLSVIEAEVGLALSTERSGDGYRASLERVATESRRLRGIVDDLLWLARLDTVPSAPADEPVDLVALVGACVARFAPIARQRSITLSASAASDTVVRAPAEWLDRLVSVLVDNACRYTGPGGSVAVTVASSATRATVTVDDSGPGIAEEDRDDVLRRFHRANPSPGGAGLGLSIADAVVRATHGRWEIGSSPAGGARMQVSWPRLHPEPPEGPRPAGATEPKGGSLRPTTSVTRPLLP
ncbi:MAG TPA: HAMP domain-containing sensor histidine kinase [Acidimicrobiales bacterium]|nr:HAMP domain-containing sensor histidine kinase [Acidimicrobiales bacterium]